MNNRTEEKLKSIDGMRKAMTEILAQAWERGRKFGRLEAQESSSWIPVTERLPEINVEVIVTDIETIGTYASWYLGKGFWECDNGKYNNRIIAWMPLPKPYTKEEQS